MTGVILDSILMLLLVAALGYGVRLEKKLTALREGQMAFAGAVTELNAAAGRAEAALASLRAASQETDLLHDRIVKAREARNDLDALLNRSRAIAAEPAVRPAPPVVETPPAAVTATPAPAPVPAADRFAPVLQALAANQAAQQSLNRARRSLDSDLFAA